MINSSAEKVLPTRYDDIDDFSNGLSRVKIDDRYEFVDKRGKSSFLCFMITLGW
ncbi:hypothetical protein CMK12_06705 [Candidatus Poribacteria bacterium]|nr:hypothetical protein [Candidatus Poribacteria bacterium]